MGICWRWKSINVSSTKWKMSGCIDICKSNKFTIILHLQFSTERRMAASYTFTSLTRRATTYPCCGHASLVGTSDHNPPRNPSKVAKDNGNGDYILLHSANTDQGGTFALSTCDDADCYQHIQTEYDYDYYSQQFLWTNSCFVYDHNLCLETRDVSNQGDKTRSINCVLSAVIVILNRKCSILGMGSCMALPDRTGISMMLT